MILTKFSTFLFLGILETVLGLEQGVNEYEVLPLNGTTRIVGGEQAARNEFPWMVRIQYRASGGIMCGGALISNRTILTAAHCLYKGTDPRLLQVVAGDYNSAGNDGTEQYRDLAKVIIHEKYKGENSNFLDDIALIKVTLPFNFTAAVQPLALPGKAYKVPATATVAGWGATSETGGTATILRKVTIPIVSNSQCNSNYGNGNIIITSNQLCAGTGGKDSCQGDSGGPLMCNLNNGTRTACGIVSFGYGCARPGYPGVYTRVSEYNSWILKNDSNTLKIAAELQLLVIFTYFVSLSF